MGHVSDGIHALIAGKTGAAAEQRGNQKCDANAALLRGAIGSCSAMGTERSESANMKSLLTETIDAARHNHAGAQGSKDRCQAMGGRCRGAGARSARPFVTAGRTGDADVEAPNAMLWSLASADAQNSPQQSPVRALPSVSEWLCGAPLWS
jgi:hypothetical protein